MGILRIVQNGISSPRSQSIPAFAGTGLDEEVSGSGAKKPAVPADRRVRLRPGGTPARLGSREPIGSEAGRTAVTLAPGNAAFTART
jgi:hypothetical protein